MAILSKAIYRYNEIIIQLSHDICYRTRTNKPKIHMEPEETQNCQSIPKDEEQSGRYTTPGLQTMLQGNSSQNSMVGPPRWPRR